jgi:hypothetical protein
VRRQIEQIERRSSNSKIDGKICMKMKEEIWDKMIAKPEEQGEKKWKGKGHNPQHSTLNSTPEKL